MSISDYLSKIEKNISREVVDYMTYTTARPLSDANEFTRGIVMNDRYFRQSVVPLVSSVFNKHGFTVTFGYRQLVIKDSKTNKQIGVLMVPPYTGTKDEDDSFVMVVKLDFDTLGVRGTSELKKTLTPILDEFITVVEHEAKINPFGKTDPGRVRGGKTRKSKKSRSRKSKKTRKH